ncbi:MAG: cation transporter, partial [Bdellovibrionales bacterium]|nr:cation transporter [Bdellovibrionales bacterium]
FCVVQKTKRLDTSLFNYGFGKFEQLSSTMVAGALFVSGVICIFLAVERAAFPAPLENAGLGLFLALLSVVGNGIMWNWFRRLYRKDHSPISSSQSHLFFSKMLASSVVAVSLLLGYQAHAFPWLLYSDAVGSVLLGAFLLSNAHTLARDAVNDLVDRSLHEAYQLQIMKILIAVEDEYEGFSHIRTRQVGPRREIQVYLTFHEERTMQSLQATFQSIQHAIESQIPLSSVIIIPVWDSVSSSNVTE